MKSYCKSCFRDLPSDDAECPKCQGAGSVARPSLTVGLLLFVLVLAGTLTFDVRLTIAAAALAVVVIAVQIVRVVRGRPLQ